ncbi:MAG: hypothetical protein ACD_49C00077G0027 [uncultured bacterium (gcode 4)]|uniref:Glutamine--fructose-6-phosphate aminotransferase [isomerizing] n=1 Tax=uncultured bacterium (gcode 4) TaxID=1234023 RepID=K2BUG8_9BACT|nr:MAG: hypothetical protein ACD_49C00077G0027 [uncultured bacterium (gcode 4)]
MCWIFWYIWNKNATSKLIHWLEKLEYRWYDSSGFVVGKDWDLKLIKSVGKVSNLSEKSTNTLAENETFSYGIAHTRWATHGGVTEFNCHPHYSENERIFLVHNWIIENYRELKDELLKKWYSFYGETDSEVVAKLIEENWDQNLLKTVEKVLPILEWAYAFLFISRDNPDEIIWVKYWSPLVFGYSKDKSEFYFSSDTQALAWIVDDVIFLDDGELVYIKNNDYTIKSEWKLISKSAEKIDVASLKAEKWDFKHFMLKEIFEQPKVLEDVFRWRIDFTNSRLNAAAFEELDKHVFSKITFVACGTSYHAGWLGTYWFEDLADMESRVEVASEFEYKNIKIDSETLYVFISQSGETADSIEPLKYLKSKWASTFWIVNVVGSTISRLTDFGLFTRAGTEVWVASTKAFTAQICTILLLALYFGEKNWNLSRQKYRQIIQELHSIPEKINELLSTSDNIRNIAENIKNYKQFFFLGRHLELAIAYESSLKFKEISYLNSQALPSGELKHWSLALVDEDFPSMIFMPNDFLYEKNLSSVQEVKARKWEILAISDKNVDSATWNISIPQTLEELYPFLTAIAGQLVAYHTADLLYRNIDKPRNLAKSVTVK